MQFHFFFFFDKEPNIHTHSRLDKILLLCLEVKKLQTLIRYNRLLALNKKILW